MCQPPLKFCQQRAEQHDQHQIGCSNAEQREHRLIGTVHDALRGVQQLRDRDYVGALRTLNDYKCQNLAIVLLSLSYDVAAFEILEQLPPAEKNPRTDYLSAIALSRMNRPREGLEYYLKAIQADPVLKFRGNLDPEIQILYKQNNVKASW